VSAPDVEFHPAAADEAAAAIAWYAERSPAAAERLERAIVAGVEQISEGPDRWPLHDVRFRKVLLRRFPYLLIYRVLDDRVQVVAVAHGHRRPGYWRDRLA
jgi:plasmid stabilization system protein ParE